MDKQEIEIIGRNWFKNELVKAGINFATPERDNGIDLIAYEDRTTTGYKSIPIQLKVSTAKHFSIDEKYKKISKVKIIFIWFVTEYDKTEAFCFKYNELEKIAKNLKWTTSNTWLKNKSYNNNNNW